MLTSMFPWIVLTVVVAVLFAAWLYDHRVRARRGRLGSVTDAARSSSAGVTADPEARRGPIQRPDSGDPWFG
jgi:hypothetical protein